MEPIILYPDVSYRHKLLLIVAIVGLVSLALSIVIGLAAGNEAGGTGGAAVGLAVALLLNALWLVPISVLIHLYYRSLQYEIHNDEVIVRAGVVTQSVKHVPFRTVTNLKVSRGPLDRLFGIGTLDVQTAGTSGQTASAEESLAGLPNVQKVYEQIAASLRRFRGGMTPTQTEEEIAAAEGQLLHAILDELRALRETLEQSYGD